MVDSIIFITFANSYKIKLSTKDYLNLTTKEGADSFKVGDQLGDTELKELDIDELNKAFAKHLLDIIKRRQDVGLAIMNSD